MGGKREVKLTKQNRCFVFTTAFNFSVFDKHFPPIGSVRHWGCVFRPYKDYKSLCFPILNNNPLSKQKAGDSANIFSEL